jgi:aspartate-semialdehyde dehydrogenase
MTEKCRIAIVGATSLQGRELNEALPESVFKAAEVLLIDDKSQAGQIEAMGDEAVLIQGVDRDSFAQTDFVFFASSQEMARKYWRDAFGRGASIIDLSYALEDQPGVLVRAPWVLDQSTSNPAEPLNLSTPAIIPAHPVALALALIMTRLQRLDKVRCASATVLEPASEYGRAAIDELHQQTVSLLNFQSLPKEIYETQVAFNVVPSFGDSKVLRESETRIRRHYELIRSGGVPDVGIQLLHVPVFHGTDLSLAIEFEKNLARERVEAVLRGEHVEIVPSDMEPPDNLRSAGQGDVLTHVRTQSGIEEATNRFWIWASLDNLRIASLNALACAADLRRLRPKGKVQ